MGHRTISRSIFLFTLVIAILSSCYYDNKQELYPLATGTCDTAKASYSQHVAPVMSLFCVSCHNAGNASGSVRLDYYDGVKAAVTSGRLMGSIQWKTGYLPMPQGGVQLSDCNINKIQAWINAKTPNN